MFHHLALTAVATVLVAIATCIPVELYSVDHVDFNTGDISENLEDYSEVANKHFASSKLSAVPASSVGGTLRYRIGKRVPNDRLVSHNSDRDYWDTPQNVTLILQYPTSGTGAIVTYVEVVVDQSSNLGAARVIAGGIGKRFIASVIEGNRTYWFNYSLRIYGI